MLKRIIITILALTLSVSAFAQDASDLERRLRDVGRRVEIDDLLRVVHNPH